MFVRKAYGCFLFNISRCREHYLELRANLPAVDSVSKTITVNADLESINVREHMPLCLALKPV